MPRALPATLGTGGGGLKGFMFVDLQSPMGESLIIVITIINNG
jgi:hypothetical protein